MREGDIAAPAAATPGLPSSMSLPDLAGPDVRAIEYSKTNHIIVVKTNGMRSLRDTYHRLGFGRCTPKGFSALTVKFDNPRATAIMFATGIITMMGPDSFWGAMYVLDMLRTRLKISIATIKLSNIVVTLNLTGIAPAKRRGKRGKHVLDIRKLYNWSPEFSVCDEYQFPSCSYKIPGTSVVANIFRTGSVVVLGNATDECVRDSVHKVLQYLHNYHCASPAEPKP